MTLLFMHWILGIHHRFSLMKLCCSLKIYRARHHTIFRCIVSSFKNFSFFSAWANYYYYCVLRFTTMNSLNYHNTFESLNMCSDIAMGLGGPRGPDRHSTPLDIAGSNETYTYLCPPKIRTRAEFATQVCPIGHDKQINTSPKMWASICKSFTYPVCFSCCGDWVGSNFILSILL